MKKILFVCCFILISAALNAQTRYYVSSDQGNDTNPGTIEAPFKTIGKAIDEVKSHQQAEIILREGFHNLQNTEVITPSRIGSAKLTIKSFDNEQVTIASFKELDLNWKKCKDGIYKAPCQDSVCDFYVNGQKRILARYPNYKDDGRLFGGTSEDALSAERIKKWKNPAGGIINSLQKFMWGSQHYMITGKLKDSLIMVGGHQMSHSFNILHPESRFVENIREELDTLGEWFWDRNEKTIYYKPISEDELSSATFCTTTLPCLIKVEGTYEKPVRNISVEGITFTGTTRTIFMPYDILHRSDWSIYRGASLSFVNSENCSVKRCEFKDLGGNSVYIGEYAKKDTIKSNHIHHTGGGAINIVGNNNAVRSGALGYENFVKYENLDLTPGPCNDFYPRDCIVEDNLIHNLGQVEKQVAGVQIHTASHIIVSHNSIYDVPRAGINIGCGAFGGHVVEYNDVFNAVLETGDHGCINTWGRDRYWQSSYDDMTALVKEHPELILLDAVYTSIIRYNRFRCDNGWDIDLDDGSSNYHIYGNLCLNGGIKLREGFYRIVENNITVNNSLHPHVWFPDCHDIIRRNIFMKPYMPILVHGFGEYIDYNFFTNQENLDQSRELMKGDAHSISGSIDFTEDYKLMPNSPVSKIGFENIPNSGYGVYTPALVRIARTPEYTKMGKDSNIVYYPVSGYPLI